MWRYISCVVGSKWERSLNPLRTEPCHSAVWPVKAIRSLREPFHVWQPTNVLMWMTSLLPLESRRCKYALRPPASNICCPSLTCFGHRGKLIRTSRLTKVAPILAGCLSSPQLESTCVPVTGYASRWQITLPLSNRTLTTKHIFILSKCPRHVWNYFLSLSQAGTLAGRARHTPLLSDLYLRSLFDLYRLQFPSCRAGSGMLLSLLLFHVPECTALLVFTVWNEIVHS